MQNGLLLCPKDVDAPFMSNPAIRAKAIAEVLANGEPEAANETGRKRANPNNIINQF